MTGWTHAGAQLPWLRGQGIHLAGHSSQPLVAGALAAAGYRVTVAAGPAGGRYLGVAEALRLPATAAANLDALADALRELPDRWPGCPRLAVLVPGAHRLVRTDLLAWTELCLLLRQASAVAWDEQQLVFETVFFLPDGSYGADQPS